MTDCLSCSHAHPFADANGRIDFLQRICKERPPTPILVQTPQGVGTQAFFPIVGKGVSCDRHDPKVLPGEAAPEPPEAKPQ